MLRWEDLCFLQAQEMGDREVNGHEENNDKGAGFDT
jgi:hypothetical protein